ncbi:MAG: LLM class flavin-dependent oxidoreductase [Acidobacteriota bacterium]|nr:LLM class flavin-dependent oxidoreductase [Acidobacteriota bacterium]
MRTAIGIGGAASGREDFVGVMGFAVEAEKLGVDAAWSAEAWGQDAIAPLAYLAARTEKLLVGTGIMQISARVPVMTAMTAMTMATVSDGRFLLGLGASGPQVVEGLHGRPFAKPLARMRETIEIIRIAASGARISYIGEHHELPLPGGEGKAIRLAQRPNPDMPIYLATLGPKALELTGELANGWLGTSFTPEHADAHLDYIRRGAERAGRTLDDIDIAVGGPVGFGDDVERMVASRKPSLAFTLGAMGSPKTNFYNEAYRRGGYEDAAIEVQRLWIEGKREEAAARVPDQMVLENSLIGPEKRVRERIRMYRDAGVDMLRLDPMGATPTERLDTLGRAVELVREETG